MCSRHQPANGADSDRGVAPAGTDPGLAPIEALMHALVDPDTTIDDRAAVYAVLQQIGLRIKRTLSGPRDRFGPRDELIAYMEASGLDELGPLSLTSRALDPTWTCNDPGNWTDDTVQGELDVWARVTPEYFRHVPAHWEVDRQALGADLAARDPAARRLFAELKERGYYTSSGRAVSLAVREATTAKR